MKKKNLLKAVCSAVAAFVLFMLLPLISHATAIEGRVFNDAGPLKGAKVYVYRNYSDISADKALLVSGPVDEQGVYKFQMPPGNYYFTAKGQVDGKDFFAYHGNNPVKVEKENVWITLMSNEVKAPVYSDGDTSLKGVVTYKGKPLNDAYIALYAPDSKTFKGLGLRTESIYDGKEFNFTVPPGKYVVIAKRMEGEKRIRPLKKGDFFCYYPQNPVEVKADKIVRVEVSCYPKNDRGSFTEAPMIKANDYSTIDGAGPKYKTGIKGRVTDLEGKPAAGVFVLAHRSHTPVFFQYYLSHGTEYIGETDKDGRYFIPMDSDGDFYVVARSSLGGGPHGGELHGLYMGNPQHVVSFKQKYDIENIDIVVGTTLNEKVPYTVSNPVEIKGTFYETDYLIDKDTVWKGDILINGTVSVKKGVTLTIEPGTVVKFKRLDRDTNGVGDGEILIEGRIVARGTKDKKIIFTSAEGKPKANDWSYVVILSTGSENVFEFAEFHYAFTGIQVHYSKARLTDCLFADNNEGMRFNRSNIILEYTSFINNDIGVRFPRLEGNVAVRNNLFRNNNVGLLFMRPHVNTVGFEEPIKVENMPLFRDNNIYDNHNYNAKVGDRQYLNLDVTNNWWGNTSKDEIGRSIFDKKNDSELGNVNYWPVLSGPVKFAGVRDSQP